MSRLSREKKREQKHAGPAAAVVAPLDVHVRGGGTATIGGVPVVAVDGEEIQRAVLGHLHRIALATGHPVLASVRDERIGYVVPLRVECDGSSHFTAEPLRTPAAPPSTPSTTHSPAPASAPSPSSTLSSLAAGHAAPTASTPAGSPEAVAVSDEHQRPSQQAQQARQAQRSPQPQDSPQPQQAQQNQSSGPTQPPGLSSPPLSSQASPSSPFRRDEPTHLLRQVSEPVRDATPTFPLRAVPEPEAVPGPAGSPAPEPDVEDDVPSLGTVTAPTGVFGPPPPMDALPHPDTTSGAPLTPAPAPTPTSTQVTAPPPPVSAPTPLPLPVPDAAPATSSASAATLAAAPTPFFPDGLVSEPEPDFKPTPARGFDAVAEAVLGDDPRTLHGVGAAPALLGEPMAQINEAVRAGRTDVAAALAERTATEASGTLGPEHPEVLRLRELTAYIAYLAGDPLRAFHVSLDLARIGRRSGDAEAAYGNVQSAATAWRAVRDPLQGLNLGTELLGLWTELAAGEGPAADDAEELESARARMLRLAERARRAGA
ncbi:tetratricopeptide repeat protein [Streptomyces sp. NBC_00704]|uniref:tetratricopeptide repeat protein n=1 Tax=Streptomyces sp. NBC_00704 TaxID=2975809 RepID=UPI002E369807|nr:tetratricopeptide repeat protein [Streptomyces sp. NBC_00704]